MTLDHLKPIAKALVGTAVAGLGALAVALEDGTVNTQEWVTAAIAALTALGAVWGVPNLPSKRMIRAEEEAQLAIEKGV